MTSTITKDRKIRYLVYIILGALAVILGVAALRIIFGVIIGLLKLAVVVGIIAFVGWIIYKLFLE